MAVGARRRFELVTWRQAVAAAVAAGCRWSRANGGGLWWMVAASKPQIARAAAQDHADSNSPTSSPPTHNDADKHDCATPLRRTSEHHRQTQHDEARQLMAATYSCHRHPEPHARNGRAINNYKRTLRCIHTQTRSAARYGMTILPYVCQKHTIWSLGDP